MKQAQAALNEIQLILNKLKDEIGTRDFATGDDESPKAASEPEDESLGRLCRRALHIRDERRRFLPPTYFGEPAFDILLDLLLGHCEDRIVYVNDACVASHTPISTALRWIRILVKDGYATRHRDEGDLRRTKLRITASGKATLGKLLLACYPE